MPPKNRLKKSVDRKLKRFIESKLMQITLRIDGHLYDNQPILTKDAHVLKLEVSSYKKSCKNDERSLQVIEKLSRILQGIIDEQNSSVAIEDLNSEPVISDENTTKITNSSTNISEVSDPIIKSVLEKIQMLHDEPAGNDVNHESIENGSNESVHVEHFPSCGKDGPTEANSIANDKPCQNNKEDLPNPIAEKTHALLLNVTPEDIQNLTNVENNKENSTEDSKEVNNTNCEIIPINNDISETNNNVKNLREESESITIFKEFNEYTASLEGTGVEKAIDTPAPASKQKPKRSKTTNRNPESKSVKVKPPRKRKGNVRQSKEINKKNEKIYTESMDESGHSKPRRKNTIDLSWIENIKYVREVQEDEFDSKMIWDDIDFSFN